MSIKLQLPKLTDLKPKIMVIGVGGAGCNAINNMIATGLDGVEFVVANTDAQSLAASSADHKLQLGVNLTEGLGAGARPEIGQAAAEEAVEDIRAQVSGAHMVFIAAGMGGGTGTGAAAVVARCAREMGILTVGVVTKPFQFEGTRRMRVADAGISELRRHVDTLIVIPNQNLFRVANDKTSFAKAFVLADQVLYSGVACIVDLIIKEGLINLDFADVRAVLANMGTAMMGTGRAEGDGRAAKAAEEAISNPLLDDVSLAGAQGLLLSITGGDEMTLYEIDEAATRVRKEVNGEANIIVGATFDEKLGDAIRVSIVASGMERAGDEEEASQGWPNQSQPLQSPHVQTYSYSHQPPKPPPHLSALMSGEGYSAAYPSESDGDDRPGHSGPPAPANTPPVPNSAQSRGGMKPWRGPGNVTVEEGGVPFSASQPDAATNPAPPSQTTASFVPAAPARAAGRPNAPRMPQVSDFPPVGQREYHAKRGSRPADENGSLVSERPARKPSNGGQKRLGIFGRLSQLAGGSDRSDSGNSDDRNHEKQHRVPDMKAGTGEATAARAQPSDESSAQACELPVFFGRG